MMSAKSTVYPKVVLATLSAKFIHSALALRYLRESCQHLPIQIAVHEYHINMPPLSILSGIHQEKPDVVGFSCYIWNISETLHLAAMLKQVNPDCVVVLGGPEVSYDPKRILKDHKAVDFILAGEAEESLPQLLEKVLSLKAGHRKPIQDSGAITNHSNLDLAAVSGLSWRQDDGTVTANASAAVGDLSSVPSPYSAQGLENLDNKLVYIESSRGCPFSCQYCLSSRSGGVRYFPLERVKREISLLVAKGCPQIKFVDRTFNCHKARAMELWQFMRDLPGSSVFHFEIAAELLDEDMLDLLATVPVGKFQFEIGVQTTTEQALSTINRNQNWDKLADRVSRLTKQGHIEIHLDLIAGLPGDSLDTFGQAVDQVFSLKPTRIQLGFLKVLKGSGLWSNSQALGLVYQEEPPYEILATPTISYDDLIYLKQIEELVDLFYNTHRFDFTLAWAVDELHGGSLMGLLDALRQFWEQRDLFSGAHKQHNLPLIFAEFLGHQHPHRAQEGLQVLLFDYAAKEPHRELPAFTGREQDLKQLARQAYYDIISNPDWQQQYLPHLIGLANREIDKKVRIMQVDLPHAAWERASQPGQWYLFDYSRTHPITGRAAVTALPFDQVTVPTP